MDIMPIPNAIESTGYTKKKRSPSHFHNNRLEELQRRIKAILLIPLSCGYSFVPLPHSLVESHTTRCAQLFRLIRWKLDKHA